jgi:hypothetical protein
MKPNQMTFQQIVAILEEGKIPCIVKQYEYDDHGIKYTIELGFNWPEELVEVIDKVFDGRTPSYIELCGDSCGGNMIAKKSIAGGKKDYFGVINKW